ncbi:MAG: glycosyltransferase family 2 protein [Planctomycetota bacterium]
MGTTPGQSDNQPAALDLSVVAPAHNEEGNVAGLVAEIEAALTPTGKTFEFVIVDDGSTDGTFDEVAKAARADANGNPRPWLRCVRMSNTPPGKGNGQSAAFHAGFRATRGRLIAVLDADLQNDPADIPAMLDLLEREGADFVQGDRSAARRAGDAWIRQVGSIVGRKFRLWLLGDSIRDTGCSLRVMKREIALRLPLEFKGVHRFIPVSARHMGYTVVEMPVAHRHRHAGETKYGAGITKRALPGLIDLFAVRWMRSRRRPVTSTERPLLADSAAQPDAAAEPKPDSQPAAQESHPQESAPQESTP